jgi:hypothetical protein
VAVEAVLETLLPRTAADVFATLTDLRTWPEWLVASGVVGARVLDDSGVAPAAKLEIEQRLAGRATTLRGRVVALEADRHLAVQAKDAEGVSVELEALLAPDGAMCTLRWSVRLKLPLKYRFFESMIAPQVREAAGADLERLRRRLSAVAG